MLHGNENWLYEEDNKIRLGKYDAKISRETWWKDSFRAKDSGVNAAI